MNVTFRAATVEDSAAIHALIEANLEIGHLLPRTFDDVRVNAPRFIVAVDEARVVGCAELAPLSKSVAEVRSLVVDQDHRGRGIGPRLVAQLSTAALARGFATLTAFTHEPAHFVRLGFTIVPHMWVPEKIAHDCTGCALFRKCGQHAVTLALRAGVSVRPQQPAALMHGIRGVAARRPNVERLQLRPVACEAEPVPA
jgi:amino-acid N-acetyltransferase